MVPFGRLRVNWLTMSDQLPNIFVRRPLVDTPGLPGLDPGVCGRRFAEGRGVVATGTARDNAGNSARASMTVNLDNTAPSVAIQMPANGKNVVWARIGV